MKKQKETVFDYEKAVARLEEIVKTVEDNKVGLDHITTLLQEANTLVAQCRDRLLATEADIKRIMADESDEKINGKG